MLRSFSPVLALSFGLTACAGLNTRLPTVAAPDLAAETARQEITVVRKVETDVQTLLNVGWPILVANADLCPRTRPAIGVKTHSLDSYGKRLRDAAGRILGADDMPRVFQIAEGSPAAQAGLQRGDILLDIDDDPTTPKGDAWEARLQSGTLKIKRGGETISLAVTPDRSCDYRLRLSSSGAINAYADGRNITLTAAMMDFVKTDQELALIIGHELGHNTMGHIRKIVGNYIISLGGTRYTRPFESEADYVGLYYMVRAGYSPVGVEDFWRRLATKAPRSVNRAKTHPTFPDRFLRITAARREIEAKQAAGTPLVPNFLNAGGSPSDD